MFNFIYHNFALYEYFETWMVKEQQLQQHRTDTINLKAEKKEWKRLNFQSAGSVRNENATWHGNK